MVGDHESGNPDARQRDPAEITGLQQSLGALPLIVLTASAHTIPGISSQQQIAVENLWKTAFIDADIIVTALAIGCATFLMATVGILIGRFIGEKFGHIAEAIGGIGLILVGTKILIEHTLMS